MIDGPPLAGPRGVELDPVLVRARAGDRRALEDLLARHADTVQRFGFKLCRDEEDARDVAQDTLLLVSTRLPDFEGRSSFTSWLFALARSACARKRRGLKNRPAVSMDSEEGAWSDAEDPRRGPEEEASMQQLVTIAASALQSLPEAQRDALLLRDLEGLTAPEAAEVLGIGVDALKSRLHRAREALREAVLSDAS